MPARFPAGRALRLLAASLVVTGVLAGPGSAAAAGSTCQNWTGVPPPNPGTGSVLQGVAAVSACDAWAVGSLIEHWDGSPRNLGANPHPRAFSILDREQAPARTDLCAA